MGLRRVGHYWVTFTFTLIFRLIELSQYFNVSSVQFSRSVMSDSLRPRELQHAWLPCPTAFTKCWEDWGRDLRGVASFYTLPLAEWGVFLPSFCRCQITRLFSPIDKSLSRGATFFLFFLRILIMFKVSCDFSLFTLFLVIRGFFVCLFLCIVLCLSFLVFVFLNYLASSAQMFRSVFESLWWILLECFYLLRSIIILCGARIRHC